MLKYLNMSLSAWRAGQYLATGVVPIFIRGDPQPAVSSQSIIYSVKHNEGPRSGLQNEQKPGNMVGATGFEPVTPCAQGRCATRLRYAPTGLKQGDFHSNRFSSYRGFAWVDLDFRTFWFDRPVFGIKSSVRSPGNPKKPLSPLLRKPENARASLIFPVRRRWFSRASACILYGALSFARDSFTRLPLPFH